MANKAIFGFSHVVGGGMSGSVHEISGETCRRGDGGRSQSLRSTESPWRRQELMHGDVHMECAGSLNPLRVTCHGRETHRQHNLCGGKEGRKVDVWSLE
jgi:hypothetical protein